MLPHESVAFWFAIGCSASGDCLANHFIDFFSALRRQTNKHLRVSRAASARIDTLAGSFLLLSMPLNVHTTVDAIYRTGRIVIGEGQNRQCWRRGCSPEMKGKQSRTPLRPTHRPR